MNDKRLNPRNIDPLEASHRKRSNYVQALIQRTVKLVNIPTNEKGRPPKQIVQFWDDIEGMPIDVKECIDSWTNLEVKGFSINLFGKEQAREFIRIELGNLYVKAFDKCYHPAMQSDYFRLCYIFIEGGCYVDTDDIYTGKEIEHLFRDGRLKIQPLCYDISKDEMIPISINTCTDEKALDLIFYFNNNPLIATRNHPIIKQALLNATISLLQYSLNKMPEIQSISGPGNLTQTIFLYAQNCEEMEKELFILYDWENIASTKWNLSYRNDERNWRLSNGKVYRRSQTKEEL